ncbi:bifunctional transcriptional activator/DNA repair enzyme AdaA [Paenibacillus sp. sgz500958]|uniref:bifunctional transcriptional activator/DNA repair enzyme AdaA n=1 Tax=Paenibacillus sp. sgz500958 TaxID=3242475 RepID=UPI0036D3572D
MENGEEVLSEAYWQAVVANDASYDGRFYYAVKTTGVYCRPSCKSKLPNPQNVRIFTTSQYAAEAGFRPCKRCKPTGERLPDKEWVEIITNYIDQNYMDPLTLETLADMCHGSPYHLHRTFKKIMHITPVDYIQHTRITKATEYLIQSDRSIADIAAQVGLPNTPYFITLFKKKTGLTPVQYRFRNTQQSSGGSPNHSEVPGNGY